MKLDRNFFWAIGIMTGSVLFHFILMNFILDLPKSYYSAIYLFVILALLITSGLIIILERNFREFLGYLFLIIITLKLVAAKVFIDFIGKKDEPEFKFSFLVLYLISLTLITWFTSRKLLKSEN